ncbi:MAG: B12-binding domain-containing radical SAM protein, partial [Thermodesulfobacteriota bacterium]
MKILLVQSYLGGGEPPIFPIGLACLKSGLAGHEVKVFDMNVATNPFAELKVLLKGFSPALIGISLRNIDSTNKRTVVFYYKFFSETLELIKASTDARVAVGGTGFSIYARRIMEEEPRLDYGVYLEGEETFSALVENLGAPENVKSIFYRKNGRVLFTGGGNKLPMEKMGLPDIQGFEAEAYKKNPDSFGIETKRGCALDCIYCIYGFLNGKGYRLKPPKRVVDEIEGLKERYGVSEFTFVDSVFNIPEGHAAEICKEIIRRGLKVRWSAWFNEKGLTREFCELAREAGCGNFILSPDGLTDGVLKKLRKNIRKSDIMKALEMLKGIDGVEISYNFFKNPPG